MSVNYTVSSTSHDDVTSIMTNTGIVECYYVRSHNDCVPQIGIYAHFVIIR